MCRECFVELIEPKLKIKEKIECPIACCGQAVASGRIPPPENRNVVPIMQAAFGITRKPENNRLK
jgi:hypothetical protein